MIINPDFTTDDLSPESPTQQRACSDRPTTPVKLGSFDLLKDIGNTIDDSFILPRGKEVPVYLGGDS